MGFQPRRHRSVLHNQPKFCYAAITSRLLTGKTNLGAPPTPSRATHRTGTIPSSTAVTSWSLRARAVAETVHLRAAVAAPPGVVRL